MALKYGPRRSGSKRNSELIDIDPRQLIKQAAPEESRDALDDELAMHMENANRRYNNLLISPQRKIIEDILLETPEGESPPVSLIMQKINGKRGRKINSQIHRYAKSAFYEPRIGHVSVHIERKFGRKERNNEDYGKNIYDSEIPVFFLAPHV